MQIATTNYGRTGLFLLGTHGTSVTRAQTIVGSQKFIGSTKGNIGSGVYFWAYESSVDYGIELAKAWWELATKHVAYEGDIDTSCAVLCVQIRRPEDANFLDATQGWFQEALHGAIKLKSCKSEDVPEVTALLIDEIQKEAATIYYVIKVLLATPPVVKKKEKSAAQMVSKMSNSYVVKQHGIHFIENIELLK